MVYGDIGENDLHTLIDGRLAPGRRCELEAFLATHPDAAERVRDLRDQRALLAELGETLADAGPGPILSRSAEALVHAVRRHRHVRQAVASLAAAVLIVAGRAVS